MLLFEPVTLEVTGRKLSFALVPVEVTNGEWCFFSSPPIFVIRENDGEAREEKDDDEAMRVACLDCMVDLDLPSRLDCAFLDLARS